MILIKVRVAWCNIVFTLLLACWMIWGSFKSENAAHGEMRVHRVVVIDDANKERIVIAAPLKEPPVVNGKTNKRRVGVSAAI